MKDLKLVALFALPVLAVVVGGLVVGGSFETGPSAEEGREDDMTAVPVEGGGRMTVPKVWEKVDRPRGALPLPVRAPPTAKIEDWRFSLDRLERLLAEGTPAAWAEIGELMSKGVLEDPAGIQKLLLAAMAENPDPNGLYVVRLLPMLVARNGGLRDQMVLDLLAVARESEHANAVRSSLDVVGQIGDAASLSALSELARSLELNNLAEAAIQAIGAIGTRDGGAAAPELVRLLREMTGSALEAEVVKAIGSVRSPVMVGLLTDLSGENQPRELRLAAVRGLGATKEPEALVVLRKMMAGEPDVDLGGAVVLALASVGSVDAVDELLRIRRESGIFGKRAGDAIALARGPGVAGKVLDAYRDEQSVHVKRAWIEGVGRMQDPAARKGLREILNDANETSSLRGTAAHALGRLRDGSAAEAMVEVLESSADGESDRYMRIQIMNGLEKLLREPAAREALERLKPVLERIGRGSETDPATFKARWLLPRLASPR